MSKLEEIKARRDANRSALGGVHYVEQMGDINYLLTLIEAPPSQDSVEVAREIVGNGPRWRGTIRDRDIELLVTRVAAALDALRPKVSAEELLVAARAWRILDRECGHVCEDLDPLRCAVDTYCEEAESDARSLKVCKWERDPDMGDTDTWVTDCGQTWQFTDEGPAGNGCKFCFCCGGTLVEVKDSDSGRDA